MVDLWCGDAAMFDCDVKVNGVCGLELSRFNRCHLAITPPLLDEDTKGLRFSQQSKRFQAGKSQDDSSGVISKEFSQLKTLLDGTYRGLLPRRISFVLGSRDLYYAYQNALFQTFEEDV